MRINPVRPKESPPDNYFVGIPGCLQRSTGHAECHTCSPATCRHAANTHHRIRSGLQQPGEIDNRADGGSLFQSRFA